MNYWIHSIIYQFHKNKEKYITYTRAHSIQNKLLEIIASNIRNQIVSNIRAAGKLALILPTMQVKNTLTRNTPSPQQHECRLLLRDISAADIARHEQVAVILWYVNEDFIVNEHFIGFLRATRTDGETLYHLVHSIFDSLELDINDLVAQCYDGAANMRDEYKGVATWIKHDNPKAIYIHCSGHIILNLALVDAAKAVVSTRNT